MTTSCPDADTLARHQFRFFDQLGSAMELSEEERRRALRLSLDQWSAWTRIRDGGPLPATPDIMLLRLGSAAYRLSVAAERSPAA